ncbi:MAG: PAS domain-containing sensor histidine kinase [Thermodesulfatator sp.]|nr:MAG: PAS domain-containing sensor histidine kinase [Thermodesulfatator sp.]
MKPSAEERLRRRRELIFLALGLVLFLGLVGVEFRVFQLFPPPFTGQNLLIFILIQINLILLLLVLYLMLRNLLKTVLEARAGRLSRSLRLKLTLSFLLLSFLPALLLFTVSHRFIETSLEYWFSSNLDQQLEKALFEARAYYQDREREILLKLQRFSETFRKASRLSGRFFRIHRKALDLDTLEVYDLEGHLIGRSYAKKVRVNVLGIPPSILQEILAEKAPVTETSEIRGGVLLRVFLPAQLKGGRPVILAGGLLLDPGLEKLLKDISSGVGLYQQLKFLRAPLKTSLLLLLLLVTLLTIFVGVWFGLRFARRLTEPLQKLTQAAERLATRDFEVHLPEETPDEVGVLVKAFRRMTEELRAYREKIEESARALAEANQELERRTAYLETILTHITAGVLAVDEEERLTLANQRACELLGLPSEAVGRPLSEILLPEVYQVLRDLKERPPRDEPVSQPLRLFQGEKTLVLGVTASRLPEEAFPGYLFILEDLTEKERMERLAAWREVARRIAHEVKNPLTPIQLSAQRLRRRLEEKLPPKEREILTRCTATIETQVEELKHLVNEFSAFARLPGLKLEKHDLSQVVREVVDLYREAHREVHFRTEITPLEPFFFDRDQVKRIFLNLFDNAIAAMKGQGEILVSIQVMGDWVQIRVEDDGPGIPPEIKARLFEPYASGKGSTGLGLAIVNSIVEGHGGEIRVEDRRPRGARFIIRLPYRRSYA